MEYDLERQHKKGKLHAIERIELLCDKGTFTPIYTGVHHNCTSFGMDKKNIPYDGVITGFALVGGKKVAIYSQDFTVQGGSLGLMHGKKIAQIVKLAIEAHCPVVGINDSGGARIQEGVDSLCGYGELFYQNVRASGAVPQISVIVGPCAGGAVYSPGLTDFIFTVDKVSYLFITGPRVVKSVMGQDISEEDLGGANIHSTRSGVADFMAANEDDCFLSVRKLLSYIPQYYGDSVKPLSYKYNEAKCQKALATILPESSRKVYDMKDVINLVVDEDSLYEVKASFATNAITGFARIAGRTVGVVGNNPKGLGGVLNCDASDKIARFVRYCDSFNIPLVTFVDVPGFLPGAEEEQKGIIRHGAKVVYAYAEATVPKITVIVRKAYGGAYIAMCSRHLGADFSFAWDKAQIAVMGAEGAIGILYAKEQKDPANADMIEQKLKEYRDTIMTPDIAAKRGYVTEVIAPETTRHYIEECLSFLSNKGVSDAPLKKHGNVPL